MKNTKKIVSLILALAMLAACPVISGAENSASESFNNPFANTESSHSLSPDYSYTGILQPGDSGEAVSALQERLRSLGYLDAEPSGIYDDATGEAMLLFQQAHNLLATGMADKVTWNLLFSSSARPLPEPEPETTDEYYLADVEESGAVFESFAYSASSGIKGSNSSNRMLMSNSSSLPQTAYNTDEYGYFTDNGFVSVKTAPLSTFAADVDTSSYAQLRRRILSGESVPADSVRVEEMLNYFSYDYNQPAEGEPLGVTMELARCPWNDQTLLLQIGLQAPSVSLEQRKPMHLVFLIDTSGSMYGEDRLDLVKRSFLLLLDELRPDDVISIVAYASQDRVVLEGAPAGEKTRIMEAISELEAGGSTNGSAGILRAYEVAEKYLPEGGFGRILLATDGDLNMGITSEAELARLVSEKRKTGVSLTCLGFGMGNYKDNKMEALADYGDGSCRYIDSIYEARRALVTEGGGTFVTVAKDVKLQLDFNPARIRGYRLIGYEDRLMAAEDFADDTKDGGEIGSGHRVTALYEIVPVGSSFDFGEVESKYTSDTTQNSFSGEWLTLSVRAKEPDGDVSRLYTYPVTNEVSDTLSDNMKFAAAVAETAMLLRSSEWSGTSDYNSALSLLRDCAAVSGDVYKEEFLYLVNLLNRAQF